MINIELTNYASPGDNLADLVAGLVLKHTMQERVLFSSFHPFSLVRIRCLLSKTPTGLLALEGPAGRLARGLVGRCVTPAIIHPCFTDVDEQFMRRQKQFHRRVNAWTVNDPREMLHLALLGVDGIFIDDPRLALQTLNQR